MIAIQRSARWKLAFISSLALAGCATKQAPLNIDFSVPPNPPSEIRVHIAQIVDSREFEISGKDPAPHQMATEGLQDPEVTQRCIAQLRDLRGKPILDFLLPEPQSASSLIREALTRAFRESGFVVDEANEVDLLESTPVVAEIVRFWAWNTGSWVFEFKFEAVVTITAAIAPFERGRPIRGRVTLHSAVGASERSFRNTTMKGLDDFVENVRNELDWGRKHTLPN